MRSGTLDPGERRLVNIMTLPACNRLDSRDRLPSQLSNLIVSEGKGMINHHQHLLAAPYLPVLRNMESGAGVNS